MTVVFTGGGTGGHVYPALALAEAFAADPRFAPLRMTFIGSARGVEARLVARAGYPFAAVPAAPLERRLSFHVLATMFTNLRGLLRAYALLERLAPDVVIATGGYVALPVVAALRLRTLLRRSATRIAVLEPNAVAGLTNRLAEPLADEVWLAFAPDRSLRPREVVTGTPVRRSLRDLREPRAARRDLGLDPERETIVVFGGSQGARSINAAVAALVEAGGQAERQFLLVTGEREATDLARRLADHRTIVIRAYVDDPATAYAAADLVVARSGASTLAELAATATPALLVPYPHATADHQRRNAERFAASGAAAVLADADLTPQRLAAQIDALLEPARRDAMRRAARANVADATEVVAARVVRWLPGPAAA